MNKLVIGTRGSKLSIVQTNIVRDLLKEVLPNTEIEIQTITTTGDKDMSPIPLDTVGKGWFTKELDKALLDRKIDLAVHSLKDIPEELPQGLIIAAIPKREDARESLISNNNLKLNDLPKGAIIGTDSTRRKSQILNLRPDLIITSLRGNVNRRLEKLDNKEYDGIFLAVAGLKRLGLEGRISEYFEASDFIPSPGQGALAIVVNKNNDALIKILEKINDKNTIAAVKAERAFSKKVEGGCKMPVGAYAYVENNKLFIHAMIGSPDGKHLEKQSKQADLNNPEELGYIIAKNLLKKCEPWYKTSSSEYIVVTRPDEDEFIKKLEALGFKTLSYPTISIEKSPLNNRIKQSLINLNDYDLIIFTSKQGVRFFIEALRELKIDKKILKGKFICVVGPKTEEEVEKFGLKVNFIPSEFTTEDLAKQIINVEGKKILLARSDIANPLLSKILKKRKAIVTNIPIYNTKIFSKPNKEFKNLLEENEIKCITFTSPSTVEGFVKSLKNKLEPEVLSIPILSIGPVTSKSAKKNGFKNIFTAKVHTIDGMLTKLKEIVL